MIAIEKAVVFSNKFSLVFAALVIFCGGIFTGYKFNNEKCSECPPCVCMNQSTITCKCDCSQTLRIKGTGVKVFPALFMDNFLIDEVWESTLNENATKGEKK